MVRVWNYILLASFLICQAYSEEETSTASPEYFSAASSEEENRKLGESKLAAQVYAIIDHYKQDDPVGIPGLPVPDPMEVPDIKKSIPIGTLTMKKTNAYGISKFRLKSMKSDLKALQVFSTVQLDEMIVKGHYILSSFLTKAEGPFVVILKNVLVKGNATLGVEKDGKIRTQSIDMDIQFQGMSMDFQNLGFMGSLFQSFINSAPNLIFDAIKPFMLKDAYEKMKIEIDTNIEKMSGGHSFPNSISPLDMAVAEGRKKAREMGFDPYHVKNYNHTVGVFSMSMSNTWITGVSSFYRVGDVIITIENKTVSVKMQVGTQKIMGSTQWDLTVGSGMITRTGQAQFTVDYIKVNYEMKQPLDTRKHPVINDLQFELGNIQARCDGAGTIDYILEASVNILPNLLRYQIMDALENPAKMRVQEILDKINTEQVIKEKLVEFENMDFKI